MTAKIDFLNPFGTNAFDKIIDETLTPYLAEGTEMKIGHLKKCPENIDFWYYKHLIENDIIEYVLNSETEKNDAVIIGCCYDPALFIARELLDIPVVGPLEASLHMAPYYGHSFSVITDCPKAVPYIEGLIKNYGADAKCRSVSYINWWIADMIKDTEKVASDAVATCERALNTDGSEVAILACTIIGACLEREILQKGQYKDLPIINPNIAALKWAEMFAELYSKGKYSPSRQGFYSKPQLHSIEEFESVRNRFSWT